jgi:glycosyltransferase involved in cell wall biosynthesis
MPIRELPALDLLPLEPHLPARLRAPAFALQSLLFGAAAAARARRADADLHYTREWLVARWFDRMGLPYVLEEHRSHLERPSTRQSIAATHGLAASYRAAGVPAEKIVVAPDGVDVAAFGAVAATPLEARQRFDLPTDGVLVGYVGRFQTMNAEKGIVDLLDAAAAAPEPCLGRARFAFVGGPMALVPAYLDAARQRGLDTARLTFRDRIAHAEVPTLLRALDVCVMPFPDTPHYRHDMSPLKMFEYMAAGRAILATDLPSVREVLVDGESALLVPPGDAPALARGMCRLLADADLRERLGVRARAEAARYSWDARARRLLEGLPSLPGGRRVAPRPGGPVYR